MTIVIEKLPVSTTPPTLPPFLRPKKRPERRTIIIPDIVFIQQQNQIVDHENNWTTIIYQWMIRITGEGISDPNGVWERTHSSSRKYRQWLETYEIKDGIPPHINFGGAIKAGEGDPTFYPRWQAWIREYFA